MEFYRQPLEVGSDQSFSTRRYGANRCPPGLGATVRLTIKDEAASYGCKMPGSERVRTSTGENCVSQATATMHARP